MLGRQKSERRSAVDARPDYRNGYGKLRRLSWTAGTITLRRPRVQGLAERFESRILPLFKRRTREVGVLLPELYLHGLAQSEPSGSEKRSHLGSPKGSRSESPIWSPPGSAIWSHPLRGGAGPCHSRGSERLLSGSPYIPGGERYGWAEEPGD